MDQNTQELYVCNGCNEHVGIDRARISCYSCPGFHLCANCFVIKQFSKPHTESHSTMVLKKSGYVVPSPPGFPPRPKPALPPRNNSRETVRVSEVPTANWGALWNIMKAPLEKKDKNGQKEIDEKKDEFKTIDVYGRSMSGGLEDNRKDSESGPVNILPPSPPKSVRHGIEQIDTSAPSYPVPVKWKPLFEADGTPTPTFVVLMSTFFGHLDPEHTGYLRPERFSSFLDAQGYDPEQNSWKRTLGDHDTDLTREMADFELGLYYSENGVSHTLNVRMKASMMEHQEQPKSDVQKRIRKSISFRPNMPTLSRQGFLDLMSIEYHKDFDKAHEYLKRAIKAYGIWSALGEMPRNILPEQSVSKVSKPANSRAGAELISAHSKSVNASDNDLAGHHEPVEENTSLGDSDQDENAHVKDQESALQTSMALMLKGGEEKVAALLKKEEIRENDFKKSDTEEEHGSDNKQIKQTEDEKNTDAQQAKNGDLHAMVESPVSKFPDFHEDDLYKGD